MKKLYLHLFKANWVLLFVFYFLVSFLINFFNDAFVQTDELYYRYLEEQYEEKYEGYEEFEEDLDDLEFLDEPEELSLEDILFDFVYLLAQVIISVPLLAMLFSSGYFLKNDLAHIKYSVVFKAVLVSSFVFLIELCVRSFYFKFIEIDYSFDDVFSFKPFHLVSLFDKDDIANWVYPFLNLINLYDFAFLISIAYLIGFRYRKNLLDVLEVTAFTYFVAIVMWQLFLLYLRRIF